MLRLLHEVYVAAGPPGLRPIALGLKHDQTAPATLNHHAIAKVLRGKQLPGPLELTSLTTWLFKQAGPALGRKGDRGVGDMVEELLRLREAAQSVRLHSDATKEGKSPAEIDADTDTYNESRRFRDERRVLGCMLRSKDAIADVVEFLTSENFENPVHRDIYNALLEAYASDSTQVAEAAIDRLAEHSEALKCIQLLLEAVINPEQAALHAEVLYQRTLAARAITLGRMITEQAERTLNQDMPDVDGLLTMAEDGLISLVDQHHILIADALERGLFDVESAGANGTDTAIRSGFRDYDALYTGLKPGQLIIIGGAAGIGKSTMAIDLIRACSIAQSKASLLISLQAGQEEMAMRLMSAEGRVAIHHMRAGTMTDDDWTRLARCMPSVASAPITIVDDPSYTVDQLVRSCKRLRHFKDLQLAVIDSVDLLPVAPGEGTANVEHDLSFTLPRLRQMARELRIPVVCFYQIGRIESSHYIPRPELHHLPAVVEKFADVVGLLHREDAYEREHPRAGEADLFIARHRYGPTSTITMAFQGHYSRFVDMSE